MSTPSKNLYAVLGVSADVDAAALTAAYKQAIRLNSDISDEQEKSARLAQINDAYALLSNPVRRGVYDASLASGSARQIEAGISHPTQAVKPSPATRHTFDNSAGALSRLDPGKIKLWRKGIMLALVLLLPLFYLYRQANVLQMRGEWQQSLDKTEQQDAQQNRERHAEIQEMSQLQMRRMEITQRLQYLGQIDAADSTVHEALEFDKLTAEKRTLDARLQHLQQKHAPKY